MAIILVLLLSVSGSFSLAKENVSAEEGVESSAEVEKKRLADAGFGDPEIEDVTQEVYNKYKGKKTFTHGFDLTLVMLRGAEWDRKTIIERTAKMMKNFAQCGVKMRKAQLVTVTPPAKYGVDISREEQHEITKEMGLKAKPSVHYIRSDLVGNSATAWIKNGTLTDSARNTLWVTRVAVSDKFERAAKHFKLGDYTPEGHELAHIFLNAADSEHLTGNKKNLLHGDFKKLGGKLTVSQCDRIVTDAGKVGLIKPLKPEEKKLSQL